MASSHRRLAAIFAADVAGYSRLMRADEEGTHEQFKGHRDQLVAPKIREHHGRIVKFTGDGLLAEFTSVIDAVLCAIEIQQGMQGRNVGVAEHRRLDFRIGINLGDVIAEPEDIYGDGVNIAARLEAMAQPNGICISQVVYEQVRDKLPYEFEDLGLCLVKNISRPLHAFALHADAIAALPLPKTIVRPPPAPAAAITQWQAPRLSIVVLPFKNLSDDRERQYLADAITDDLTTDLSRIPDMVVISRNTAFAYEGKPVDTRQVARELSVRYVLQGSVRSVGNRVRVNTQLIDAETNAHLWAERFDRITDDLFALQDEVTSRIAVALDLEIVGAEAARPADNPDALDYILRGRAALYKEASREAFVEAIELLELALERDPRSPDARALLGRALAGRVLEQMTDTPDADIKRANELIEEALSIAPRNALAHFARGQTLRVQHRYADAIPEYERVIELDRNSVWALAALGQCRLLVGSIEEAIPAQEQAIRLSPRDPNIANWYWRIGMVHLLQSRTEGAILWLERARSANPNLPGPRAWLASAYALSGEPERAAAELGEARSLSGDRRYSSIAEFARSQSWGSKAAALAEKTFFAGLRLAGVPEE